MHQLDMSLMLHDIHCFLVMVCDRSTLIVQLINIQLMEILHGNFLVHEHIPSFFTIKDRVVMENVHLFLMQVLRCNIRHIKIMIIGQFTEWLLTLSLSYEHVWSDQLYRRLYTPQLFIH